MQLHELKPKYKRDKKKRVGRGGDKGDYSGRGDKGQKSRSGFSLRPLIRDFFKRYPKRRGIAFEKPPQEFKAEVNLDLIDKKFKEGEVVSPLTLCDAGLINSRHGQLPKVKILGRGSLNKN